jgi:hypothetical protein
LVDRGPGAACAPMLRATASLATRASLRIATRASLRIAPTHRLLRTAASAIPSHHVGPVVVFGGAAAFAAAWSRGGAVSRAVCDTSRPPAHSVPAAPIRLVDNGRLQLRVLGKMARRIAELLICFFPPLGWLLLRQTPLLGELCFSRARLDELVVSALARAGPVGIKWGQWASTRYDLFDEPLCKALGALTNQAPAHTLCRPLSARAPAPVVVSPKP